MPEEPTDGGRLSGFAPPGTLVGLTRTASTGPTDGGATDGDTVLAVEDLGRGWMLTIDRQLGGLYQARLAGGGKATRTVVFSYDSYGNQLGVETADPEPVRTAAGKVTPLELAADRILKLIRLELRKAPEILVVRITDARTLARAAAARRDGGSMLAVARTEPHYRQLTAYLAKAGMWDFRARLGPALSSAVGDPAVGTDFWAPYRAVGLADGVVVPTMLTVELWRAAPDESPAAAELDELAFRFQASRPEAVDVDGYRFVPGCRQDGTLFEAEVHVVNRFGGRPVYYATATYLRTDGRTRTWSEPVTGGSETAGDVRLTSGRTVADVAGEMAMDTLHAGLGDHAR